MRFHAQFSRALSTGMKMNPGALLSVLAVAGLFAFTAPPALAQNTYGNITISGTALINLLDVGPGSDWNQAEFGAGAFIEGTQSYADGLSTTGPCLAAITTEDSYNTTGNYPLGFVFKVVPDANWNPVCTFVAGHMGVGPVPLVLNTDVWGNPQPAPVLVGTVTWDQSSMLQVLGTASFTGPVQVNGATSFSGPVDLQPAGDLTMGSFTATAQQANNAAATRTGAGMLNGATLSGTASQSGTGGH